MFLMMVSKVYLLIAGAGFLSTSSVSLISLSNSEFSFNSLGSFRAASLVPLRQFELLGVSMILSMTFLKMFSQIFSAFF